jgi:chloramphenicol-sensitive protein RarD
MTDGTKGAIAMVVACTIWGLSPLFYAQLTMIAPLEVLAYRSLWSLVFFAGILIFQGRIGLVFKALGSPRQFAVIAAAALGIAGNWFGFIFAIGHGYAVEASLGYYIFPLLAVVLGRFVLGEALRPTQWTAVGLATVAVVTLTYGLGVAPWIALYIAGTFGIYGIIKKRLDLGPVVSVTAEVLVLAPLAISWIAFKGTGVGGGNDLWRHFLLMLSGPLTASPLILFAYAARRVRLSTVGLIQYINPTLQFFCATVIFAEPFTGWHKLAFGLIWLALAIYSASAIRQERAARRVVSNAATSGAIEI